jgi:glycine oxidase
VNALALAGAGLYEKLCERLLTTTGIDPEYTQSGMLIQPLFDAVLAHAWCAKNQIKTQKIGENLLLPQVAQVRNPRLLQSLKQLLIQTKVNLLEHTQLEPLQQTDKITGWKTNTGTVLEADAFVVTSGAWSFELLKDTAANLNIKPMRGQILLYQIPQNSLKHIVYSNGFYLVPRRDGHLLAGSTLEDVGFDPRAPIIKHWSGLRPGTPDNLPTISAHPSIENLYLNTGHFRYGLTMAPASAQLIAAIILGEKPQINASPYAAK